MFTSVREREACDGIDLKVSQELRDVVLEKLCEPLQLLYIALPRDFKSIDVSVYH